MQSSDNHAAATAKPCPVTEKPLATEFRRATCRAAASIINRLWKKQRQKLVYIGLSRCTNPVKFYLTHIDVEFKFHHGLANADPAMTAEFARLDKYRLDTVTWAKQLKELDNKIVECKIDGSQWVLLRERTDKSFPNSFSTAEGVMESIRNPVDKDYLLNFIRQYGWRRKPTDSELMPPPHQVAQ
ncbi:hypothetical protein HPB49_006318 [Dermacentor silvarum]|uniref:Uncharacterized protein n=1 Tax=Dermacentor silvarum TaxID=543639 RepID=A0ACB8CVT8_DERSI|nr:hypothetical protein HPB49_006318 [Dermacentor silvarum]